MSIPWKRIMALMLVLVPISASVYGWTLLRNLLMESLVTRHYEMKRIFLASLAFLSGIIIIAGGIYRYEKKRGRTNNR